MRKRHHMTTKKLLRELQREIDFKMRLEKSLKEWLEMLPGSSYKGRIAKKVQEFRQCLEIEDRIICKKLQRLHFANY